MRFLTIKRRKSFVASLGAGHAYIQCDEANSELEICGYHCKKLGDLKNGGTLTCEIGEEKTRVFVIYDKASKDWCNDMYEIEAGSEDVHLSGVAKFGAGNPFRFDNNPSEEAKALRKKNGRKGSVVMIIAVVVGFLLGFFLIPALL